MRKAIFTFALMATSLAMVPQAAQAQAETQSAEDVLSQKPAALELAKLLNNEETLIGDADDDAKAADFAVQLFGSHEELAEIEKEFPGVGGKVANAIMPIINQSMRDRMPQLQDRQARLYAANFEQTELEKLLAFYSSPTGQKLVSGFLDNIEPNAMLDDAVQSENFEVSPDAALKDIQSAAPSVVATLNDNDRSVLIAFMQTGLPRRIQLIARQTQQIALTWLNEFVPGEEAKIEAVVEGIFAQYETGADQ